MKTLKTIIVITAIFSIVACKKEASQSVDTSETTSQAGNPVMGAGSDREPVKTDNYIRVDMDYNISAVVNERNNAIFIKGFIEVDTLNFVVKDIKALRKDDQNILHIWFSHPDHLSYNSGNMDEKLDVTRKLSLSNSEWKKSNEAKIILVNDDNPYSVGLKRVDYSNNKASLFNLSSIFSDPNPGGIYRPREYDEGVIPISSWVK